jgi:hypothetical protein
MSGTVARVLVKTQKAPNGAIHREWFACSSCDRPVSHGDRFCRWCGVRFL